MSQRRRSTYGSSYSAYSRREKERKVPSPLPYLLIAVMAGAGLIYFHYFAYKSLSGTVSNSYTGSPMADIPVVVMGGSGAGPTPAALPAISITATTGPAGEFNFSKLPDFPVLSVSVDGYTPQSIDTAGKTTLDIQLVP